MQRTTTAERTNTGVAARRVGRRVRGDLLAIHERFDMRTAKHLEDLAHDIQVGLEHDCISEFKLFLYKKGASEPTRAYTYRRTAPGSFAPSEHSGNIARNSSLVGGRLDYEVWPRSGGKWDQLKKAGKLRIGWSPCTGRSTAGMTSAADGGHASGQIGFARDCLSREGR